MHTEQELIRQIKALGISTTDTLVVHTALKSVGKIEAVEKRINSGLRDMLGISAKVHLVNPKTITRSEGKAKRVIDNRKF